MVSRVQQQQQQPTYEQRQAMQQKQQQQDVRKGQQKHQQERGLMQQWVKINKGLSFKRSSISGDSDPATSAILLLACAVCTPSI
uniref:Uncharacterized protein n=1 Tax=Nymphaea colorata TaxID=210225 RepID=A0A5K1A1V3_9MAGN